MKLKDLSSPFHPNDIEWRIGRSGTRGDDIWAVALCYITSRALHARLDAVCGIENWQLRYHEHLGETICEIGIRIGDEWIWKAGGGASTKFEAFKGGLSSAEKRAGVPWGVGRYLYKIPETFVKTSRAKVSGWNYQKKKDGATPTPPFYWQNPVLPKFALPDGVDQKEPKEPPKKITHMDTKQVEALYVAANAFGVSTEDELREITQWYQEGDRMTWLEGQKLIDDFGTIYSEYSAAQMDVGDGDDPADRKDDVPY